MRVRWTAVILGRSDTRIDDSIVRPIAARTRIVGPSAGSGQPPYPELVERFPTRRDAAISALRDADIAVCWAVGSILRGIVWDFRGPVVAVSHGVCEWTQRDMRRQVAAGATHVAAVSTVAAGACPPSSRPQVILNGVNRRRCLPQQNRTDVRRAWLFEGEEPILVGYVGRFAPEKNAVAAAMAVANLPDSYHAVFVGNATDEQLGQRFDTTVRSIAGPRARIIPATDFVGDIYGALDVLVLASPAEGCSLTLAEGWLSGVPVVSTPVGIVPEFEKCHGQLVYRVPIDPTPGQLAEAVRMAAQQGRKGDVPRRARQIADERLTSTRMVHEWTSFLEEVVLQRSS